MTKELSDFFKIISEGKKKSVKEQNENESLLSNDKVSVTVKATELKDFFTAINEEKRKLKEQREKDQKKLHELETLLFSKDREPPDLWTVFLKTNFLRNYWYAKFNESFQTASGILQS